MRRCSSAGDHYGLTVQEGAALETQRDILAGVCREMGWDDAWVATSLELLCEDAGWDKDAERSLNPEKWIGLRPLPGTLVEPHAGRRTQAYVCPVASPLPDLRQYAAGGRL